MTLKQATAKHTGRLVRDKRDKESVLDLVEVVALKMRREKGEALDDEEIEQNELDNDVEQNQPGVEQNDLVAVEE